MDFSRKQFVTIKSLAICALLLSSCTKKEPKNYLFAEDLDKASKIYSNRPSVKENAILLLKLTQPALLSSLKTDKLKNIVDASLSAAIKEEQTAVIAKLKAINPEILVLYKYKMVLNGLTVIVPAKDIEKVQQVPGISLVKRSQTFDRPMLAENAAGVKDNGLATNNSALFIGAKKAYDKNIKGQNIRVGIIDTGIDYTHAMLGGSGDPRDYENNKPGEDSKMFPNLKVVGGLDFAGTNYNAGSDNFAERIPVKDNNPIDEAGHGTHVAGTVAGIGDGVDSYNGVAPASSLYALKVFGAKGSTSDEVVISALEFAADPNGDEVLDDRLDVVNLSLGSSYGTPKIFYNEAIKNLTLGGTVVVCSAGNSGDVSYIVGAPSVSDEALSVAASVDGMDHNWKFRAVSIQLADKSEVVVEAIESSMSKPISSLESAQGKIVYVGTASKDFSDEEKAMIKGNVALIDRGEITFSEKIKRAQDAGAIGVIVVNNTEGDAFGMGGDGKYDIPAIMITQSMGLKIKASSKLGEVVINFIVDKQIEKSSLIDTITDFSSRGPRSEDSIIKPEISAPGQNIISAAMGMGKMTIQLSGTSMSGPHVAGVMALMKQNYPELSVAELKTIVMGTAKSMHDKDGKAYTISRVGAGRVQIDKAMDAAFVSNVASISLGDVRIDKQKKMFQSLQLKNIRPEAAHLTAVFEGHPALAMDPVDLNFTAKQELAVGLKFTLSSNLIKNYLEEVDGYVKFYQDKNEVYRLPVLAIVRKVSGISATGLTVNSTSKIDSDGSLVELALANNSDQKGMTFPMNLIAVDARKNDPSHDVYKSKACDLEKVGYKIVDNTLFVGFKLYQQVTTWDLCEVNMLIDADGDGVADQEVFGTIGDRLEGLSTKGQFASVILDANKARQIRAEFDKLPLDQKGKRPNYASSVVDAKPMLAFEHSSVAIMSMDVSKLKLAASGNLQVKFSSSSYEDYAVEGDDFLEQDESQWRALDLSPKAQSYIFSGLEEVLDGHQVKTLSLTKGVGNHELLLLTPTNRSVVNVNTADEQGETVRAKYLQ